METDLKSWRAFPCYFQNCPLLRSGAGQLPRPIHCTA
ncbi:MAG TPA: hypothetical protein DCL07_03880 [Cryomorphaceae bacterium]|nr:hypothetical protein [Cryomorphaceae bacterium]HAG49067.1 hypothetical protein [Cryomorphaceae bacterium]